MPSKTKSINQSGSETIFVVSGQSRFHPYAKDVAEKLKRRLNGHGDVRLVSDICEIDNNGKVLIVDVGGLVHKDIRDFTQNNQKSISIYFTSRGGLRSITYNK